MLLHKLQHYVHLHLLEPVDVVGGSLVVGALGHHGVDLLLGVALGGVVTLGLHPGHELGVVYDELLEGVAGLVDEVHMYVGVVGVHLTATLVDGHEDGLDTRGGLCHEAHGACGGDGEAGDVAAAILLHLVVECGIGILETVDEGVVLLALGVIYLECSTLLGHLHG